MKEKRLISRKEAANLLGCTAQSVSNWVKWGLITGHKTKTGELLIDRKTIEQYFDTLQDMVAIERKKAEVKALNEQLDRQIHEALSCLRITTFWGRTTRVINTIVTKLVPAYMREKRDYQFTMKLLEGQSVNQIADDGGLSPARVLQIINKFARRLYSAPNLVELEAKNEEMTQKYRDLEIKYNGLLQAYKSGVQSNIDELDFKNPIYDIKLFDCNLTVRCLNCMKAAGIETIGDLVSYEKYEVLRFRHFGKKTLSELEELLWSKGLKWGMNKK